MANFAGEEEPVPNALDGRSIEGRKSGRLSDRIRRHVHEMIVAGKLRPGDLIQIGPLATELGVSRTPAREALLSLQASNLVTVVPNQGFVVASVTLADVRDIYLMRALLEGTSAQRAASRLEAEDRERLLEIHAATQAASTATYTMAFDELCFDLHRMIAQAADSPRLLAGVDGIFDDHMRLQSIGAGPPQPELIIDEHRPILESLLEGDGDGAQDAMERHIELMRMNAVAVLSK